RDGERVLECLAAARPDLRLDFGRQTRPKTEWDQSHLARCEFDPPFVSGTVRAPLVHCFPVGEADESISEMRSKIEPRRAGRRSYGKAHVVVQPLENDRRRFLHLAARAVLYTHLLSRTRPLVDGHAL